MALDDLLDCPVEGCEERRPRFLALCRRHWFRASADLRRNVWRSWGDRDSYLDAVEAVIEQVEREPEPKNLKSASRRRAKR